MALTNTFMASKSPSQTQDHLESVDIVLTHSASTMEQDKDQNLYLFGSLMIRKLSIFLSLAISTMPIFRDSETNKQ